jgi:hypothetical protein
MPKLVIVVLVVCADPFSVIEESVGIAGTVENDSEPAVTENCVLSSDVAAGAGDALNAAIVRAATAAMNVRSVNRVALRGTAVRVNAPVADTSHSFVWG